MRDLARCVIARDKLEHEKLTFGEPVGPIEECLLIVGCHKEASDPCEHGASGNGNVLQCLNVACR